MTRGFESGPARLWAVVMAMVCLLVSGSAMGAGIPWSNGQAVEFAIGGFTASDSVAVDAIHGKLYVTDRERHRVLRFAYPLTATLMASNAEMVFGQSDLSGTAANRGGSVAANTLNLPYGLAVAADGTLWVSDYNNHRVLKFVNPWSASSGVAASVVLGQASFTTSSASTSATGLRSPCGLSVDSTGNLWVADMGNHRVLRYANAVSKTSGAAADGVLGQANFTSGSPNRGGSVAANTVSSPYGLGAAGTTLWVADSGNHRVLRFANAASKANGAAADGVLGQANFTSNSGNRGGSVAANTLYFPAGAAGDGDGRLYVSDSFNSRVLIFTDAASKANGATADNVLGTSTFTASGSLGSVWHLVYDDVNHRLLVGNVGSVSVYQYFNCYTTSTTLTSSPNPATAAGATVTFTATVTTDGGGTVASGNVVFKEGATALGAGALNGSGQAVFETSALSDGDHSIVAVFTNTTSHKGSISTALMQVVGKYTPTVSLSASANPSTEGASVTFTATAIPPTGAPTPTGDIEFSVDGSVTATVGVDGAGEAQWATSSLTEGGHTITAIYSGDTDFRSTTNSLSQTVNPEGLYVLSPVANVERDDYGGGDIYVYDGNEYGGYIYTGAFDTGTGFAAFKFDLSSLSGTITSATLKVRVGDKSLDGSLTNFNVMLHTSTDDAWTDIGTATAPGSMDSPAIASYTAAGLSVNDWITQDVTAFVQTQFSGDQAASFVFDSDAATGWNYIGFYAKETFYSTNRPVLEVQMATNVTPDTPGTPDLATDSDTGGSNTDNVTRATSLSFSGTSASGDSSSTIRVFLDKNGNGSYDSGTDPSGATTAASGTWTVNGLDVSGVTDGTYNVYAFATSSSGSLTSSLSSALSVAIDRTTPTVQSVTRKTPVSQYTSTNQVVFQVTFSEAVTTPPTSFFAVTAVNGGTVVGNVSAVTGGPQTYDVTVNLTSGDGEFRLVVATPTP